MKKDTIYIDLEDDITSIIDKISSSKSKIVALVPPKRSTVLNSAVNMKLLMKSVEEADKRVVLVTNEQSLISLAGGVSMPVAQNLHSKPYIPEARTFSADIDDIIDGTEIDPEAPIGEIDDAQKAAAAAGEGKLPESAAGEKPGAKSGFKFKIPSFERFRSRLLLIGLGLVAVIIAWYWAFWIAPTAAISIKAQTNREDVQFEFTVSSELNADDLDKNQYVGVVKDIKRNVTETFTPTGTKNVGERAVGQMSILNCAASFAIEVPAGTVFISTNNLRFATTETVTVPGGTFSPNCDTPGETTATVQAVASGDQYNLAPQGYSSPELDDGITGYGGQMSGGTTEEVTVVTDEDVKKATDNIKNADRSAVINELRALFGEEVIPINETYTVNIGEITPSPAVGDEASTASVSAEITFRMLGVNRSTLTEAIESVLRARIDGGSQTIYDNGLNALVFELVEATSNTNMDLELTTEAYVGPQLDPNQLAQEVSGKRYSEVKNTIESKPGVVSVEVDFQPPWVFSAPSADKITITFDVTDNSANND